MKFDDRYCKIVSNCILVKGYTRAVIYDLQMEKYNFVPLALYHIFSEDKLFDLQLALKTYSKSEMSVLLSYIEFLDKNNYLLWGSIKFLKRFIPLRKSWDTPAIVSHAVISFPTKVNLEDLLCWLLNNGCKNIVLWFDGKLDLQLVKLFFSLIEGKNIHNVSIAAEWDKAVCKGMCFQEILDETQLHSVHLLKKDNFQKEDAKMKVFYLTNKFFDLSSLSMYKPPKYPDKITDYKSVILHYEKRKKELDKRREALDPSGSGGERARTDDSEAWSVPIDILHMAQQVQA